MKRKNIIRKISMLVILFGVLFNSTSAFQTNVNIANNVRKSLDYYPNQHRRIYVFHDYGSPLLFDDAKFHGEAFGYDKTEVVIRYANAIGELNHKVIKKQEDNGKKASLTTDVKYDYFKAGSYVKSQGDSNYYQLYIK